MLSPISVKRLLLVGHSLFYLLLDKDFTEEEKSFVAELIKLCSKSRFITKEFLHPFHISK